MSILGFQGFHGFRGIADFSDSFPDIPGLPDIIRGIIHRCVWHRALTVRYWAVRQGDYSGRSNFFGTPPSISVFGFARNWVQVFTVKDLQVPVFLELGFFAKLY